MSTEDAASRPSHLALITANPLRVGGMQTFARFVVDAACSAGWRVTVALSGEDIFGDLRGTLDVETVDWVDADLAGDRQYRPRTILDRRRWFRRTRPDVALFAQSSNTPFRASVIGAALAGVPVVVTHRTMPWIRDFVPVGRHFLGMVPGLGLHNRRQVLKTRPVAFLADRIVYNSRLVREEYEKVYGYPRRKGVVIVNAAPSFESSFSQHRSRDRINIGYLGRLADEKRLDVLIQAVAAMKHRQIVRLLIFGDGPLRESLAELARTVGIAEHVEFRGSTPDVAAAYAELDIVAVCSRRESSSNTALEAMAAGKAVIVSSAGGLPELIDNGYAGECVPVGDVGALAVALDDLACDADRRKLMGERGQTVARRRHDADRTAKQWLDLIGGVATRHSGRLSTKYDRSEIEVVVPAG
jgi:1,2-diacylglycerol 3-alpha-glucosyltransferase